MLEQFPEPRRRVIAGFCQGDRAFAHQAEHRLGFREPQYTDGTLETHRASPFRRAAGLEHKRPLLIGDETALPAIARRLEELPANRRALVVIEVENAQEEQPLHSAAAIDVIWVHRDVPGEDLLKTVEALSPTEGELYAWVATESALSRKVRRVLLDTHGLNEEFVKAVGYWRLEGSEE